MIKLAVVGGRRGQAFQTSMKLLEEDIVLTCICDLSDERIREWKSVFPDVQGYTSFDRMLTDGDFDALLIATPVKLHAGQAIAALRAGKHVLSEVFAMSTLEEGWALIEAVEHSGKVYKMAENYCYMRENLMVLNMVAHGLFGEITYAEGAYIHDCRRLRFDQEGRLTWRGEFSRDFRGNPYPTHSLGPVAKWLGINETDKMTRTSTFVSKQASLRHYVRKNFGHTHAAAQEGFWSGGDSATTVIETESGALIVLRKDADSARPHKVNGYTLQGTKGAYLSARHGSEESLLWIEGVSGEDEGGIATEWDPMSKFQAQYDHPKWARSLEAAQKTGHGGGDFFVLKDFMDAIKNNVPPFIDVYDAVAWSSIVPLSAESVRRGGIPVDIPDFIGKKRKG